ncbi:MAG: FHA domain-containing protein [Chiayiivirga sp.]|jgi:adenylate cyclase|uniref:adenylate/guanylate cyclase domain-containing protein n=1 Tax=Chiayiivirga sp. TaxID=2041042 RepID=UPI0025C22165|nr:adenylate/guanylate cyclase domain-containing protein [Chiayiivirga sp.]MCI1709549.1 FHA domain-containing protein [Chiayiivirga sp.]MCI1730158.1 FHA domain-containing protein [Chiayiivirga sp.]
MSQTQPLCILFADVSGSTKLFEQRGDVEARRIIAAVLDALSKICASHGGKVIKTIGDEIMCTLPGALNGVMAASDMQKRVAHDINFVRDNLGIRIGLHHGETLVEDNDVYGDAVNTAARMASLAKREQIVTTATTLKGLTNAGSIRSRSLGRARVSGKLLPIEIVDIIWQEDISNVTTVQRAIRIDDGGTTNVKLTLRYRGQVMELNESSPPFTIGRDASNSLVIDAEWVSRTHAHIEYKKGYFVVADRSTNASYVKLGDDDELRLHRDEVHLRKSGAISLGQAIGLNQQDIVYFQCSY